MRPTVARVFLAKRVVYVLRINTGKALRVLVKNRNC